MSPYLSALIYWHSGVRVPVVQPLGLYTAASYQPKPLGSLGVVAFSTQTRPRRYRDIVTWKRKEESSKVVKKLHYVKILKHGENHSHVKCQDRQVCSKKSDFSQVCAYPCHQVHVCASRSGGAQFFDHCVSTNVTYIKAMVLNDFVTQLGKLEDENLQTAGYKKMLTAGLNLRQGQILCAVEAEREQPHLLCHLEAFYIIVFKQIEQKTL